MPTAYWASSILLWWKIFLKDQNELAFHPSLVLPPCADGSHLDNFPTNTSSISYEENWFQKIVEGESDNEINENKFKRKKLLLPLLQLFLFLLPNRSQFCLRKKLISNFVGNWWRLLRNETRWRNLLRNFTLPATQLSSSFLLASSLSSTQPKTKKRLGWLFP